jgi:purine nucleosidase
MKLHLDTDFGSNPDDACALAMVLGWPGAELVGITTSDDRDGRRAEQVEEFLQLLGVGDVPVAAPALAPALLGDSVAAGATVVAIGPFTNLAGLERMRPGGLDQVPVYTMGGWVDPFDAGYPGWGPDRDHNVQSDADAARVLFRCGAELTLVPCASAATACLRTTDLPRLMSSGAVGAMLARQSVSHRNASGYVDLARRHAALPDDLVNFHWDPVTCAAALGWSGVTTSEMFLQPALEDGALRFERRPGGRRTRVVTEVDGDAFPDLWLTAVEAAQRSRA